MAFLKNEAAVEPVFLKKLHQHIAAQMQTFALKLNAGGCGQFIAGLKSSSVILAKKIGAFAQIRGAERCFRFFA